MSSTAKTQLGHDDDNGKAHSVHSDPHLDRPRPTFAWKRAALVALLAVLFSLVIYLRLALTKTTPKVVHASRYSKEFRYRPAASPVITERLKDGRVRLRGAIPT